MSADLTPLHVPEAGFGPLLIQYSNATIYLPGASVSGRTSKSPIPCMTAPHHFRAGSAAGYLHPIADERLRSPQEITTTLTNALGAADYSDCVKDLRRIGIDPKSYIDGLDKVRPRFASSLVARHSRAL